MRDLMIDIETLGTKPGSVILSIGAVAFDAVTGVFGAEYYASIDAQSAADVGLKTDISTIQWWMEQSDAARTAAFAGGRSIGWVLGDFGDYVRRVGADRVWAKPPSFDLVLLEAAFIAASIPIPWHYKTPRDCRTLFDLTNAVQPDVGTAHNALDDAKSQALGVIDGYRRLSAKAEP